MEREGRLMISPKYSVQDYENLRLCVESSYQDWKKAIDMVNDRFWGRYFQAIHILGRNRNGEYDTDKVERNGFAMMALNSLLVDAFFQFENGLKSSQDPLEGEKKGFNSSHYVMFLNERLGRIFSAETGGIKSLAELFYSHIRCGILHSAQTGGYSTLACEGRPIVSYLNKGTEDEAIRVDVAQLSNELEDYFRYDYLARLRDGEPNTRRNLIKKMRFVCNLEGDC